MKQVPGSQPAANTEVSADQPMDKSRRLLLKMMGLGAGVSATHLAGATNKDLATGLIKASDFLISGVNITLFRPQDLLELDITVGGFTRSSDKTLTRIGSPSYLVVKLQPQS